MTQHIPCYVLHVVIRQEMINCDMVWSIFTKEVRKVLSFGYTGGICIKTVMSTFSKELHLQY